MTLDVDLARTDAGTGTRTRPGMRTRFGEALAYLGAVVDAGRDATGAQLCIAVGGEVVVDAALGRTLGVAMRTDHLHPGFCVTKPILGLAVGLLVDRYGLDVGEPIDVPGGMFSSNAGDRPSVAALLSHRAGLRHPNGIEWRICPPARRPELLAAVRSSDEAAYSEITAGLVLEELVAHHTGRDAAEFVETEILRPLGIADDVVVGPRRATAESTRRRTSVPIAGLPDQPTPMLSERCAFFLAETRPAFGSLVTARGLCALYAAVDRVLRGERVAGLPRPGTLAALLAARRGTTYDAALAKACDFAAMFMVGLSDHGFGHSLSARAIGHVAGAGHAVGLCDPELGVAMGLYLNGATVGLGVHADTVRSHLVDLVVEEARHAR